MSSEWTLFDTLLEPIFILNENQQIVYCNETGALIADSSVRKLIRSQKKFTEVFIFSEEIKFFSELSQITDPTPYKELKFQNQSGGEGKVQITVQRLQGSGPETHWVVFVRDVTLEERLQSKYRAELEQKEDVILELQKAQSELQNYSKNLEQMVAERTREVLELNQTLKALLDSLGQGFFLFNSQGDCLPIASKACESTLQCDPRGQKIWDVFKLPANKVEGLKKWMITLFSEMLPFDDLTPLGPQQIPHSQGKKIKLEYFPLKNEGQSLQAVVVVATDITALVQAQEEAEIEKARVQKILAITHNKKQLRNFVSDSQNCLRLLDAELKKSADVYDAELIKRCLHTLKGNASLFSLTELVNIAHEAENFVSETPPPQWSLPLSAHSFTMRRKLCDFIREVEDIVGSRALAHEKFIEVKEKDFRQALALLKLWSKSERWAEELEQNYLLEPLLSLFEPFNEVIQKTATALGKKVSPLVLSGENVLIESEKYVSLFSSLVHCFRNSVDHGIEETSRREEMGKPSEGKIEVVVRKNPDKLQTPIQIFIKDDGGGIDPQRVKNKMLSSGHWNSSQLEEKSDHELIQHIFDPSFSTKEAVTEISGRGVGLDAVKEEVLKLGGQITVVSRLGQGSEFQIELPQFPSSGFEPQKISTKKSA